MHLKNNIWLNVILLLFLAHFPLQSYANNSSNKSNELQQLINAISQTSIWEDPEWLNLIHYQGTQYNYLSQVDDKSFFFASNGKNNPEDELIETVKFFYKPDINQPDNHSLCRFPARLNWLKSKFPDSLQFLPKPNCQKYNEWRKKVPAHKVSLIFPAYQLNSPSSMFGHTLLRIDASDNEKSSTWLSMAVNFGANLTSDDNSLAYAFKGLAGGYSGTFITTAYYKKIKEYNRQENRDIWEYPLNLTAEETNKIVLHLWELKNINFDYYFFDENCSYRLLELLQVARPELKLTEEFGLTAIPIDTVRSIENANLTNEIVYRPSQVTNIKHLLQQLTIEQKDLVLELSRNTELINSDEFQKMDFQHKNISLDAAYRFLRYQQNISGRSDSNAKNSFKFLQEINKTPGFTSITADFQKSQQPEMGHLSKRVVTAIGKDNKQSYAQLDFRMAYHSLEDPLNGFLEGAQINIANFSVRITEDNFQLQKFDLIDIFSLTPRNSFFQPLSWKVYTGLEQQVINRQDHLTGHVTAGAGASYEIWDNDLIYAMLTTRLEASSQYKQAIEPALGISTGLLQHFSFGTSHLEISGEEFYHDEYRHRAKLTQNINLQRNHAIQLSVLRQRQTGLYFTEAQISYHYFFH